MHSVKKNKDFSFFFFKDIKKIFCFSNFAENQFNTYFICGLLHMLYWDFWDFLICFRNCKKDCI